MRRHRLDRVFAFIILVSVICACPVRAGQTNSTPYSETMGQCTGRVLQKLSAQAEYNQALWQAENYCSASIADTERDEEQRIRTDNFVFQRGENVALMWMVIAITLSGVILAAAQLGASFALAWIGRKTVGAALAPAGGPPAQGAPGAGAAIPSDTTSISLSKDNLAVQSSVVGVIVLTISFAFFMVFVLYVYTLQSPDQTKASVPQSTATVPAQVDTGQLAPSSH